MSWKRNREMSISGWEWQRRREAVIERDGGVCQLRLPGCTRVATTADHIIGTARGGADSYENLRAACAHCNHQRMLEQRRKPPRLRESERHPGLLR